MVGSGGWLVWLSKALAPAVELVGSYATAVCNTAGEVYDDTSVCKILAMCEGTRLNQNGIMPGVIDC